MDSLHWGIHINEYNGGFSGVMIHNNDIYSSYEESRGIALYDCSNVKIKNNIVCVVDRVLSVAEPGASGFESNNNCWFSYADNPFKWQENYGGFADFQSIGYGVNSLFETPVFVDVGNNDFHLQSGSPAIDAGTDLGYAMDYDDTSVPVGTYPDMGAFEYNSNLVNNAVNTPAFSVFPNPAIDRITIRLNHIPENSEIEIIDINGKRIKRRTNINKHKKTIIVKGLEAGMYIIRLQANGTTVASKKVLIQNN